MWPLGTIVTTLIILPWRYRTLCLKSDSATGCATSKESTFWFSVSIWDTDKLTDLVDLEHSFLTWRLHSIWKSSKLSHFKSVFCFKLKKSKEVVWKWTGEVAYLFTNKNHAQLLLSMQLFRWFSNTVDLEDSIFFTNFENWMFFVVHGRGRGHRYSGRLQRPRPNFWHVVETPGGRWLGGSSVQNVYSSLRPFENHVASSWRP